MALRGNQFANSIYQQQSTVQFSTRCVSSNDSSYVVMAHIYGIVSKSPFGLDLAVIDHTDKAIFSLRGDAAFEFYSNHLYRYADHEEIVEPYALDDDWARTCLFKICASQQTTVLGHPAFIVNDICMVNQIIDQFAAVKMNPEERNLYLRATQNVVRRVFPQTIGLLSTSEFDGVHSNVAGVFKHRIYAPFQL